ncbi:type I-E CRISPR-associated protein Cse2/CasB [Levilactobacillus huananensis]|uniref:type I-E CRISPR-associated protein Cse2/CasB n=1 Tax=Levilactobacillus huananensis TaxID=2486019 RepID=UPI000F79EF6A|nr:type I-E CRISPR-associated protein Cse2/CasB [Levilactobacillus huananensis]
MADELKQIAGRIIHAIYRDGAVDKAVLANLRNAPTVASQRSQKVWPILMANLSEQQLSKNGVPTREEVAVYTAIRFYAIYQQGNQTMCVYAPARGTDAKGQMLFGALGNLRGNDDLRVAMDRRVQPLLATTNVAGVINELSHLISILKSHGNNQQIDFAQLAQDLYWLQVSYEQASRVRLLWGQQYFRQADKAKGEKNND